jgi:hypothetical protein
MTTKTPHPFWGSCSPLGGLSGAGLLIMCSARLSWAIIAAGGLFWVYTLTTLSFAFFCSGKAKRYFPYEGRKFIFSCIASLFSSIYLFLFWLLCPFAALEVFLPILLIPMYCVESGILERITAPVDLFRPDISNFVSEAASKAAVMAVILISFSIIREPFAYGSLSFPGSYRGMTIIMSFMSGSFLPIGLFAGSTGALILLGYFTGLYQYCKIKFYISEVV